MKKKPVFGGGGSLHSLHEVHRRGVDGLLLARLIRVCAVAALLGSLTACQHPVNLTADVDEDGRGISPAQKVGKVTQPGGPFLGWQARPMPAKRWAEFEPVSVDGIQGLQVQANASLSLLHRELKPASTDVERVSWSWWLSDELPLADLTQADRSDSPVRLLLAFDGDRSALSGRDALASELVRLVTGHELPYATLTYVWTRQYPAGTVLRNPRSDRIRYVVVEQGPQGLGQWRHYERDVKADFVRAFGEQPGPLVGVGLMTDTDNTKARTRVVYGPVELRAAQ